LESLGGRLVKIVAVVGAKHSGKTTIIENLTAELKRRGFSVGAVKEMVRIPTLDTPQTETDRYAKAGATVIVAVPRDETVVFVKKKLGTREILQYCRGLDFAVLEGFETEKAFPKIVAAKTPKEAKLFLDASAVAVSGIIAESDEKAEFGEIPILSCKSETEKMADLVEQKALNITF
jgi:molybdopterin-guanine dinucleotide biosynthesis protein B